MTDDRDTPLSRNVWRGKSRHYWLTGAAWDTGCGESFELGIRSKESKQLWLLQGPWSERSIGKVGQAVAVLLDAGFAPSELIDEVFQT